MSELKELEMRLAAAMDRLQDGIAAMGGRDDAAKLEAELASERAAKDDLTQALADLQAGLTAQRDRMGDLDQELQHLREVNKQLEDNNRALREACETGQVDAALINKAMLTELESMRAARATEQAEAAAALASLEPLIAKAGGGA